MLAHPILKDLTALHHHAAFDDYAKDLLRPTPPFLRPYLVLLIDKSTSGSVIKSGQKRNLSAASTEVQGTKAKYQAAEATPVDRHVKARPQ